MAQSTTNIRMSVDTSQAKSQVSSFNDEMQKMNGLLKEATDNGDFRGAANLTAAINQLQQAQRSITQQINETNKAQKAGMSGLSGGVTGFISGAGGIASSLGNGSIGGAASGTARMTGNALAGASSALSSAGAGGLGKILGYLGLGSLAIGAGVGAVTNLSDKYQETLPDMAEFMRFSGGKETDWYHQATKYTQGTTMSQMDLVRLATEQAQYGLYGSDALQRAQTMGIVSYNTGIDTGTLTRLQGISDRFGLNENAIGNSLAGFYQSGLKDGRQQEFFDGVLRVMEEGINAGFVRSSEDVAKNLAMLSELSGNNPAWQGQYGAQKMSQINSGFANATNLQSVTDVMLFDAAKGLYSGANATGTYIDQMMVLERGLDNPELLKNFYNSVNDAEGGNLAAKIERFKQASGLNYTGAVELYNIAEQFNNPNNKMTKEEYDSKVKSIMTNQEYQSDLSKQTAAMNKLSEAMYGIEEKAFKIEMSTASGAGAAILSIEGMLSDFFGKEVDYYADTPEGNIIKGEKEGNLNMLIQGLSESPGFVYGDLRHMTDAQDLLFNLTDKGYGDDKKDAAILKMFSDMGIDSKDEVKAALTVYQNARNNDGESYLAETYNTPGATDMFIAAFKEALQGVLSEITIRDEN